jgi:glycosyltransferase involved in cell wall biosynthesis
LRITIVTGFFLPVPAVEGGATERSWHGLANAFAAAGHSVTFVSRSWPGMASTETVDGISHIRLPGFAHTRRLSVNLVLDFLWGVRVARALPLGDVVICNTIALPVWLRGIKPSAGKVAVVLGRAPKGQVRFYRGVARIYSPSSFVAAQIPQQWAIERTRVIGNPIDWHLLASQAHQTGKPITLGFAGRLHPEKGLEILIRAACILARREGLPDWRLKIIGPSSVGGGGGGNAWVDGLKKEASTALGARVEWLPPEFDPKRLAQTYGTMDIFCYPSLAEKGETFGVSIAEAMAAKCACVVSALGCFSDLVTDGRTGLIFDHAKSNSDALLADCLGRLILDADMRKDLALNGQQHALRFDFSKVSRTILDDLAVLTGAPANKHG